MYNRIYNYLQKFNILNSSQYGFRTGCSTELALIDTIDKLYSALDNGCIAAGIFLDLSKAFDTIDHKILLDKLEYYGIRGIAHSWLQSYLSNRKQYCYYASACSQYERTTCGVPQGSILGPLLFLLYINDINHVSTKSSLVLFADDTNIFYSSNSLHDLHDVISNDLPHYFTWFSRNKLSLNVGKTNYIIFSKHKCEEFNIIINGDALKRAECVKFLGVYIDSKLSWSEHINYISKKVARSTGVLSKLKHLLPKTFLEHCILL